MTPLPQEGHALAAAAPTTRPGWRDGKERHPALRPIAESCWRRREGISSRWVGLVRGSGHYTEPWVDEADLRTTADEVFEFLPRRLAGMPISANHTQVSDRLGRRRADQHMSPSEIQGAGYLDFRVVWEAMLDACEEDERGALLESAAYIWGVVEAPIVVSWK